MTLLKDFDEPYRNSIRATYDQLVKVHQAIDSGYQFDLAKTEITEAVLDRLKNYCDTLDLTKQFLDKRVRIQMSDYFVETVLFFLRLYLRTQGGQMEARSESSVQRIRKAIRPDISVWRKGDLVAIIECKTQVGWKRAAWEQDYYTRKEELKTKFPHADIYLLMMTESNWNGFGDHALLNKRFFSLLGNTAINHYSDLGQIRTPLEGLFAQIK